MASCCGALPSGESVSAFASPSRAVARRRAAEEARAARELEARAARERAVARAVRAEPARPRAAVQEVRWVVPAEWATPVELAEAVEQPVGAAEVAIPALVDQTEHPAATRARVAPSPT